MAGWEWVDNITDHPLRAAFSYVLLACAVIPTYLGTELGIYFIKKGKDKWVRIFYIAMLLLTGLIILLLYDKTFNIYSSYAKFKAGDSYPFWTCSFATGWAISACYFWGSLVFFYFWLRKKS